MNPILAEDIMRQRAHRSVIVLATLLTCLLFVTDRASADGITVIVPVNMTNLHEDIQKLYIIGYLKIDQSPAPVASATEWVNVVDRSVQQDVELSISMDNANAWNVDTYIITMLFGMIGGGNACIPNNLHEDGGASYDHCKENRTLMQTYAPIEGPISDLTPE